MAATEKAISARLQLFEGGVPGDQAPFPYSRMSYKEGLELFELRTVRAYQGGLSLGRVRKAEPPERGLILNASQSIRGERRVGG